MTRADRWWPRGGAWVLPLGVLAVRPLADPDVFWHLAQGRQIVATGALQPPDDLSFTRPGAAWTCLSWAWDALSLLAFRLAGLAGPRLLPALCVALGLAAALAAVHRGRRRLALDPSPLLGPAAAVAAVAALSRAHPRPDALLLAALPLALLLGAEAIAADARRARLGWGLALGALAAAWTQAHSSFPLAWGVMAAFALQALATRRPLEGLLPAGALAALGLGLHPAGPGAVLSTIAGQLDRGPQVLDILEWRAPGLADLLAWPPGAAAAVAALAASLLATSARGRAGPWRELLAVSLVAAALLVLGLRNQRFLGGAGLALLVALGPRLPLVVAPTRALAALTAAGVLALHLSHPALRPGLRVPFEEVPEGLLSTLASVPPRPDRPRHVLGWFDLGGVLGWRLAPSWRVAMDARAELVYPPDIQRAYAEAWEGPEGLAAFTARWPVDAVVGPRTSPTCAALAADPAWGAVWVGANDVGFLSAEALAAAGLAPLVELEVCGPPSAGFGACQRRPERAAAALSEARALARRAPEPFALVQAAVLETRCGGEPEAAAAWLAQAEALEPGSPLVDAARGLLGR